MKVLSENVPVGGKIVVKNATPEKVRAEFLDHIRARIDMMRRFEAITPQLARKKRYAQTALTLADIERMFKEAEIT